MLKMVLVFILLFITPASKIYAETEKYTVEKVNKELPEISSQYDLELISIGKSEFGKEILAIKVGRGKKSILLTGSHHGREWLSTHVVMNMVKTYSASYKNKETLFGRDLSVLDEVAIWFIPMVNPDGVGIQQSGVRELPFLLQEVYYDLNKSKSSFKSWKANGLGVDLNRQYPAGWETIEGGNPIASPSHYKGQMPLEASEVRALCTFTEKIKPLAAASFHTSGRLIYWYYFNEWKNLLRDYQLAEQIADATGYDISYPPYNAVGGGYTDWFIQTYKKPALTIELSFPVKNTNPPLSVLAEEWYRNREVGLIMAEYSKEHLVD